MPKAEAGTAKAFANAQKAKGLTRLRFYCQVCEKPCRDANGYKCHIESEAHVRRLQAVTGQKGERTGAVVQNFSKQFQDQFVTLLARRYGTRRIKANTVYNEYIQERHHLHMNATRWLSLSEFVKHLGREGIAKVEEDEHIPGSWFLTWIDNSPGALARQDALRKMERAKLDDDARQRRFLDEQIRRAREDAAQRGEGEPDDKALLLPRDAQKQPIKIGFAAKLKAGAEQQPGAEAAEASGSGAAAPAGASASASTSAPADLAAHAPAASGSAPAAAPAPGAGFKLGAGLKKAAGASGARVNPLKASSASSSAPESAASRAGPSSAPSHASAPHARPSAVDQIMREEMEAKRRREERERGAERGAERGGERGGLPAKRLRM